MSDIITTIKEKYPSLTRKQKQLADYILEHTGRMSFLTLRELSKETNITPVTVLNTCIALGYSSFNEMKYEIRKYLSMKEKEDLYREKESISTYIPPYELEDQKQLLQSICEEESAQMNAMVKNLDMGRLFEVAEAILAHKRVVVCGRGVSKMLGDFLTVRLLNSGVSAVALDTELNDDIGRMLLLLDKDTLVAAISLPDYYFMTDRVVEFAKKEGCHILGVMGAENDLLASNSDYVLMAPCDTRLFLNTPSSVLALLNMLSSAVEIMASYRNKGNSVMDKFSDLFQ